ncbi:unnamed protein product, partial [Ectocarpus sp. 13 AM-2016]
VGVQRQLCCTEVDRSGIVRGIGAGLSYVIQKGGAIHSKGTLTFKGDVTFERNEVHTEDSVEQGKAGAISFTGSGTILVKSKLTMK